MTKQVFSIVVGFLAAALGLVAQEPAAPKPEPAPVAAKIEGSVDIEGRTLTIKSSFAYWYPSRKALHVNFYSFELTPRDVERLGQADDSFLVARLNGAGGEAAATRATTRASPRGRVVLEFGPDETSFTDDHVINGYLFVGSLLETNESKSFPLVTNGKPAPGVKLKCRFAPGGNAEVSTERDFANEDVLFFRWKIAAVLPAVVPTKAGPAAPAVPAAPAPVAPTAPPAAPAAPAKAAPAAQ